MPQPAVSTGWRDVGFFAFFWLHVLGIGGLAFALGVPAVMKDLAKADTAGRNPLDFNAGLFFKVLLVACVVGGVASAAFILILKRFASSLIYCALYTSLVLQGVFAAAFFAFGQVIMGVIMLVLFALQCAYVYFVRDRIAFATAHVKAAVGAVEAHRAVYGVALALIFLQMAWVMVWQLAALGVSSTINSSAAPANATAIGAQSSSSNSSALGGAAVFGMTVSLYWGTQVRLRARASLRLRARLRPRARPPARHQSRLHSPPALSLSLSSFISLSLSLLLTRASFLPPHTDLHVREPLHRRGHGGLVVVHAEGRVARGGRRAPRLHDELRQPLLRRAYRGCARGLQAAGALGAGRRAQGRRARPRQDPRVPLRVHPPVRRGPRQVLQQCVAHARAHLAPPSAKTSRARALAHARRLPLTPFPARAPARPPARPRARARARAQATPSSSARSRARAFTSRARTS